MCAPFSLSKTKPGAGVRAILSERWNSGFWNGDSNFQILHGLANGSTGKHID
jgi:hypothetical protein